jgi:hypothetical protein
MRMSDALNAQAIDWSARPRSMARLCLPHMAGIFLGGFDRATRTNETNLICEG